MCRTPGRRWRTQAYNTWSVVPRCPGLRNRQHPGALGLSSLLRPVTPERPCPLSECGPGRGDMGTWGHGLAGAAGTVCRSRIAHSQVCVGSSTSAVASLPVHLRSSRATRQPHGLRPPYGSAFAATGAPVLLLGEGTGRLPPLMQMCDHPRLWPFPTSRDSSATGALPLWPGASRTPAAIICVGFWAGGHPVLLPLPPSQPEPPPLHPWNFDGPRLASAFCPLRLQKLQ